MIYPNGAPQCMYVKMGDNEGFRSFKGLHKLIVTSCFGNIAIFVFFVWPMGCIDGSSFAEKYGIFV